MNKLLNENDTQAIETERSLNEPRSIGFARSPATQPGSATSQRKASAASATNTRPAGKPTPKRAKGRWFISLIICAILSTIGSSVWNEFIRFQAYGIVQGRVLRLAAPWSGVVQSIFVKDGEYVAQGQLLASLENTELKLRLGKLQDEIRLARASLGTRVAELKALQRDHSERALRVHVDYFELLSKYYQEKSRLDEYRSTYRKLKALVVDKAVATIDVDAAAFQLEGQESRVAELESAVEKMKTGLESADLTAEDNDLLAVEKARIEALLMEWDRLIEYDQLGEIRAPVAGRVVRRHHFTGEFVSSSADLFEVLEEGSIESVVFVPQRKARHYQPGLSVNLNLPPIRRSVEFEVVRVGDQMSPPPPSLKRYYRSNGQLVRVHLKPLRGQLRDTRGDDSMWLGAEVRVPRFGAFGQIVPTLATEGG